MKSGGSQSEFIQITHQRCNFGVIIETITMLWDGIINIILTKTIHDVLSVTLTFAENRIVAKVTCNKLIKIEFHRRRNTELNQWNSLHLPRIPHPRRCAHLVCQWYKWHTNIIIPPEVRGSILESHCEVVCQYMMQDFLPVGRQQFASSL